MPFGEYVKIGIEAPPNLQMFHLEKLSNMGSLVLTDLCLRKQYQNTFDTGNSSFRCSAKLSWHSSAQFPGMSSEAVSKATWTMARAVWLPTVVP